MFKIFIPLLSNRMHPKSFIDGSQLDFLLSLKHSLYILLDMFGDGSGQRKLRIVKREAYSSRDMHTTYICSRSNTVPPLLRQQP